MSEYRPWHTCGTSGRVPAPELLFDAHAATAVLGELLDLDAAAVVDAGTLDHLDRHLAAVVEIDARPGLLRFEAAVDDLGCTVIHRRAAREVRPGCRHRRRRMTKAPRPTGLRHKSESYFFITGIFKIQSFQGFQRGDLCRKGYRPELRPCQQGSGCRWPGDTLRTPGHRPCQTVKGLHGWTVPLRYRIRPSRRTHRP